MIGQDCFLALSSPNANLVWIVAIESFRPDYYIQIHKHAHPHNKLISFKAHPFPKTYFPQNPPISHAMIDHPLNPYHATIPITSSWSASLAPRQFHRWTSQQTLLDGTGTHSLMTGRTTCIRGMWNTLWRGDFGTDLWCSTADGIIWCLSSF